MILAQMRKQDNSKWLEANGEAGPYCALGQDRMPVSWHSVITGYKPHAFKRTQVGGCSLKHCVQWRGAGDEVCEVGQMPVTCDGPAIRHHATLDAHRTTWPDLKHMLFGENWKKQKE